MSCNIFPFYASSGLGFSFPASSLVHTNMLFPTLYFCSVVFQWWYSGDTKNENKKLGIEQVPRAK